MNRHIRKTLKVLLWIIAGIVLLIGLAYVAIQLPFVQNIAKNKAVAFLHDKIKTEVAIGKIKLNFPRRIVLENVYFEDQSGDTLFSGDTLRVDISLLKLLRNQIQIHEIDLRGINAYVDRTLPDSAYNFQYIIDAFVKEQTVTPDTTAGLRLSLDKINLDRIRVRMDDEVTGKKMAAFLRHFDTRIKEFDLTENKYVIPKIRLDGLTASMHQTKALAPETITTDTVNMAPPFTYPDIDVDILELSDIHIDYGNTVTAINSKLDLSTLRIEVNNLNLPNQYADIHLIQLDSTSGFFALGEIAEQAVEATTEEVAAALEKGWRINLGNLAINNVDFKYDDLNQKQITRGIDYDHLAIDSLVAHITDIYYSTDTLSGTINQIALKEQSGLEIDTFRGKFFAGPHHASLDQLLIETSRSHIADKIHLTYPSRDTISLAPGLVGIDAQFVENKIAIRDILLFAPQLANQHPFKKNHDGLISLNGRLQGRLNDLHLEDLNLSGLGDIHFHATGDIVGLPEVNSSSFDLTINRLSLSSNDIYGFTSPGTISASIQLPAQIGMQGRFKGTLRSFTTNMNITSSFGDAHLNGTLRNVTDPQRLGYDATFNSANFDFGKLLKREEEFGKVTINATASGTGTDFKTANANIQAEVAEAFYKGYTYQNLTLNAIANKGDLRIDAKMSDPNLQFDLAGTGNLNEQYPAVKFTLNLDTAHLQNLKLNEKTLTLHGHIVADLPTADPDYLNGTIYASHPVIHYEGKTYSMDTISIVSVATPEQDSLVIQSELLNAYVTGNYNLTKIWPAMQNTIDKFFDTSPGQDSVIAYDPQLVDFKVRLTRGPLVEQILPDLTDLEDVTLEGSFNSTTDEIDVFGTIPRMSYKDIRVDSLNLKLLTENDQLNYAFTIDRATRQQLQLNNASISGAARDDQLDIALRIKDFEDKDVYRIAGNMTSANKVFDFTLLPDGLLLNKQPWNVAPDNSIQFGNEGIMVRNFVISNATQQLSVNSEPQTLDAPVNIDFDDFKIETLTRLVTKDSLLAGGTINGSADLKDISSHLVFVADLDIRDFSLYGDTVGNIDLKVDNATANTYTAQANITGDGNAVNINGTYFDDGTQSLYDLDIDIDHLNLSSVEGFTMGEIDNASGALTGNMKLQGTLASPQIRGDIYFKNSEFTITRFNSPYRAVDEHLSFTNDGVQLNNFTLVDSAGNKAVFSGIIYTEDYRDLDLNMELVSDNFQVLNSTRQNNKLYYGQLYVDTHLHLDGNIKSPAVDGNVKVNEKTNLTIVIPQEDPGIVDRKGIVEFVDMDTFRIDEHFVIDDSLNTVEFTGINVAVNITIVKEAELNLIIDEANGDYLKVKGTGNLTGGVDPSGKVTLVGSYELEEGFYRFSFNQIKREFTINKGSTIQWTGEPLEADVNVTAVYVSETAPLTLVQSQLAEAEQNVINTYKQKIPFEILLNMKGKLMRPDVTFDIGLKEGNQGVSSEVINTVTTRLTQLRTEPSELNKQVFAVLLLNRFVSEDPFKNGPREGGLESIARQSASKILSEQLNNIIGGAIAGFDVTFDINSIEDYTTGELQNRTDLTVGLTKQLLDDRLKISVGSNFELEGPRETDRKATNIAGDVSAEYQLSKDGRYLVRAYRKDEYIVVQGQVVETGLGFVFTADYEKLRDIFSKKTEEEKQQIKEHRHERRQERINERG